MILCPSKCLLLYTSEATLEYYSALVPKTIILLGLRPDKVLDFVCEHMSVWIILYQHFQRQICTERAILSSHYHSIRRPWADSVRQG